MKREKTELTFEVYGSADDLPAGDRELFRRAADAAGSAYAPYSEFSVGAAVLMENGTVVTGSNQENAAYPSGLCAERVAVFHAASAYPGVKISAVAIAAFLTSGDKPQPASPCGSCRQVLAEYEYRYGSAIRVIMMVRGRQICIAPDIKTLLPYLFSADQLKQ